MSRWVRRTLWVGPAALVGVGVLAFALFGDADRAAAVGTVLTATVAAASLVVVVRLDHQLVAIERARRSDEVVPKVTASFRFWQTQGLYLGPETGPVGARTYHAFVVENIGAAPAYNVDAEVMWLLRDGSGLRAAKNYLDGDEFPLPILDVGGAYPIPLGTLGANIPFRFVVRLRWEDHAGELFSRELPLRR